MSTCSGVRRLPGRVLPHGWAALIRTPSQHDNGACLHVATVDTQNLLRKQKGR
jgi:hypothetical protein